MLRPVGELVGVLGELGLEGLDGGGVFVEEDLGTEELVGWSLEWYDCWVTYSSVTSAEAGDAAASVLPLSLGDDGFQDIVDNVPELVVLVLEQEHEAGGLGVERGGDVLDELGEDLLDAGVGDGRGLVEGVDAAAVGDGLEEVGGGSHCVVLFECGGSTGECARCEEG